MMKSTNLHGKTRQLIAGILVFLLAYGCSDSASEESKKQPNIFLISLDTLRADRLGFQGYARDTSPFLDDLAARSMVFRQAVVNTHGTTPSHTTMFSGLYQETHQVGFESDQDGLAFPIPTTVPLLAEMLRAQGYATVGVSDGGNIGKRFGFDRGFERYDERGGGIKRVLRRAQRYLDQLEETGDERPVFLMLHTYEIHSPYEPPQEYADLFLNPDSNSDFVATSENLTRSANFAATMDQEDLERISDLYDAGIRFTDQELERFFDELENDGVLENSVVVITSDHGEEFGEHGGLLHRGLLYDELLRVPLIIHGRGVEPGTSDAAASLVDIVPTILGLAGLDEPEQIEGGDLLANHPELPHLAISQYANQLYSVRAFPWKLIVSSKGAPPELFNLEDDPTEQTNLYSPDHPIAQELRRGLRAWLANERPNHQRGQGTELTSEERKRLEGLGYLTN